MEGPVEIQKWLHVWTEAERARRLNKKPCAGSPDSGAGESQPKLVEEMDCDKDGGEWIMPPLAP